MLLASLFMGTGDNKSPHSSNWVFRPTERIRIRLSLSFLSYLLELPNDLPVFTVMTIGLLPIKTMASKKRRQELSPRSASAPKDSNSSSVVFDAVSVPSGNVVVLGMCSTSCVNCAGMALVRVFQGHVELLGFAPPLGSYYALYSPKWNPLMAIKGRSISSSNDTGTQSAVANDTARLDAGYQARFGDSNASLLALTEPSFSRVELDDEHAADNLARDMAECFPVVLVFRAIPVTYGNVTSYFEASFESDRAVLPGFKMMVAKEDSNQISAAVAVASPQLDPSGKSDAEAKKKSVLAEFASVDSFRTLQITRAWRSVASSLEASLSSAQQQSDRPQRIVVCGAKGVGKSTYCRYLVNRLLSQHGMVAFLDTDLGQSELTPPGMVSLHALVSPLLGPGFTHMRTPLRAFFCGGTNPGNDPLYYMQAVKSLLRLYERKWGQDSAAHVPLVINTDGWIKSMGHDLLCGVIESANPDHVVQLLATTKNKQFDVPTTGVWRIHSIAPWDPVGVTQNPARSSKEMRLYRLHTYFLSHSVCALERSQLQNLHVTQEKNRVDDQIYRAYASLKPVAVPFDAVEIAFAGSSVPPSQVLFSLNGSLVGLCMAPPRENEQQAANKEEDDDEDRPPRIRLGPAHAPCLGVGIIRAIDKDRRLLLVLSPLPLEQLQRVNLLVRSTIPLGALVADVIDPVQAAYVGSDVLSSDGTGAAAMQSRNNIKRKRDDRPGVAK